MADDDTVAKTGRGKKLVRKDSLKVRLTLTKEAALKLGRVSRWERNSEGTSLELTGRS